MDLPGQALNFNDIFSRLDTILEYDGQTDRRTPADSMYLAYALRRRAVKMVKICHRYHKNKTAAAFFNPKWRYTCTRKVSVRTSVRHSVPNESVHDVEQLTNSRRRRLCRQQLTLTM